MVTPERLRSWARTDAFIREAMAALPAEVAAEFRTALVQVEDYLAHNEFGVAFDHLQWIVEEADCASPALVRPLLGAAQAMELESQRQALVEQLASFADRDSRG